MHKEKAETNLEVQKDPKGLGHAIYCARTFVGNEPFAVLLGDDVVHNEEKPCLKQMIEAYNEYLVKVVAKETGGLREVAAAVTKLLLMVLLW